VGTTRSAGWLGGCHHDWYGTLLVIFLGIAIPHHLIGVDVRRSFV
jgi:hypothetical protein